MQSVLLLVLHDGLKDWNRLELLNFGYNHTLRVYKPKDHKESDEPHHFLSQGEYFEKILNNLFS